MKKHLPFPPSKKMGQNFLFDENYLRKIVTNCPIDSNTVIIEIGSGYGSLTNKLAETNCRQVISYEKDQKLWELLVTSNIYKNKVIYRCEDALLVDWSKIGEEYKDNSLLIVGNLPYYIANSLLINLLLSQQTFSSLILLVQKEVAQRWVASPIKYSSKYSAISVFINYLADTSLIFDIPAHVFTPPPLVDGSLVVIKIRSFDLNQKNLTSFFSFLKNCFRFRRKTLWNNLLSFAGNCEVEWSKYFVSQNYPKNVRPQNLSASEYWQLYHFFKNRHLDK